MSVIVNLYLVKCLYNDGEWGGNESVVGLAHILEVYIDVYDTCLKVVNHIHPVISRRGRRKLLNLLYVGNAHYMALSK